MKTILNIIFALLLSSACFAQYNESTILKHTESMSDSTESLLMQGEHHLKSKNQDSAMYYFDKLSLKLKPFNQENNTVYLPFFMQLAKYYFQTGQFGESENYIQKAKSIFKTKIGEDHPDFANILVLLANLYKRTGQFDLATQNYTESLQLFKKIGFENNSIYANILTNLALIYNILGKKVEAENLFIQAKTQMECNYNTSDLTYVSILENLGLLYYNQLKLDESEILYSKALEIRNIIQSEQDIEYAECLNNLGNIQQKHGHYDIAESLYIQVLNSVSTFKGNKVYPHLYNNLAMFYFNTNQFAKAESLFLEVKKLYENHFGKVNRTYLSLIDNLAQLYVKLNNPTEASKYFIEASKLRKRIIYDSFKYLSSNESEEFLKGFSSSIANFNTFFLQYKNVPGHLLKEAFENELFYKGFQMNYHLELNNILKTSPELTYLSDSIKRVYKLIATEYAKYPLTIFKIDSLENVANHLEKQFGQKTSNYNDIISIVSFDDVAQLLKPKEAILEIMYLNRNTGIESESITYAAMIIPYGSKTPILVNLCNEVELQKLFLQSNSYNSDYVSNLYSTNNRGFKPVKSSKTSLYELLWKKIEIQLSGIKVCIR